MSLPSSPPHLAELEQQHQLLLTQIDECLLASPDQNPNTSPPSAHLQVVSRLLHQRLTTTFEPANWPLDRLLTFLKRLFEPNAPIAPTTPTMPTLAFAHPPHAPQQSPRAVRARSCVNQLARIAGWSYLVLMHKTACELIRTKGILPGSYIQLLADHLVENSIQLKAVIPEIANILSDQNRLSASLATSYTELQARLADFDTDDKALAFVLVDLAVSPCKPCDDPEAFGAYDHLAMEFARPYRGNAPDRFINLVTQLDHRFDNLDENDLKPYYRGTPIVQSSGTGKTRMILECHHRTPLLYVCLRKRSADGNAKGGFPLPDKGVRKYFEDAEKSHRSLCDLQVACFLGAWFTALANSLRPCDGGAQKYQLLSDLNRLDRSEPASHPRNEHFKTVSENATLDIKAVPDAIKTGSYQEIFDYYLRKPLLDLNEQLCPVSRHLHPGTARVQPPPVLVAFDECVEINVSGLATGNTQLNSLRRAWNYIGALRDAYGTLSFWLVLMSTSSSAAHLVEHVDDDSSIRRINSAPLPTFVGVGFDVLVQEQECIIRASQASTHQHIIKYGRPLWTSLENDRFWETTLYKLKGAQAFDETDAPQCFSILASRLALGLVPVHSDRSPSFGKQKLFLDKTVDLHMRLVTHISTDVTMQVASPSEPVLAIAASLLMLPTRRAEDKHALAPKQKAMNRYGSIFENFRMRCLIGATIAALRGMHGELAARIALTVAWDAAKRKILDGAEEHCRQESLPPPSVSLNARILQRAVPLDTLVKGLADLDEADLAALRERICKVESEGSSTRRALKAPEGAAVTSAWVNFTHFDMLTNTISEVSPEYLWYCWKRGVGLQMAHSQPGIDGIIPVFIGDLDEPFAHYNSNNDDPSAEMHAARYMTYIAWEAKNTADAQPGAESGRPELMIKLAGPLLKRASQSPEGEKPLTERALMCVLLDLGTATPFASRPRGFRPRVQMINGTDCPRVCIRGVLDKHAYPCMDAMKMRHIFSDILNDLTALPSYEQFNQLSNPIWNDQVQPGLAAISSALSSAGSSSAAMVPDGDPRGQQGMDLD